MQEKDNPLARKASFLSTMRAVFWPFFGVRKRSDYEKDAAQLNPLHVVIAGVIGSVDTDSRITKAVQLFKELNFRGYCLA